MGGGGGGEELVGCISFELGIGESAFHVSSWSLDCGFFQWRRSGWCSSLCFDPARVVSISGSRLAWVSLVIGGLLGFGAGFCFAVGRTSVLLFGTPDISTLCSILYL